MYETGIVIYGINFQMPVILSVVLIKSNSILIITSEIIDMIDSQPNIENNATYQF